MLKNKKIQNATEVTVDNIKYRSKLEARSAQLLKENNISFSYEPFKIELLSPYIYRDSLYRAVTYTPDFVIYYNSAVIYLELKGWENDVFPLKEKLIIRYAKEHNINYIKINSIVSLKKFINEIINNEFEEYRAVKGYEGYYEVSNLGNVRSIQYHGKPRIKQMAKTDNGKGYLVVKLRNWKEGISFSARVNRLVAEAFIPNPDNKPFVDHINGHREDNRVENLRWVTHEENQHNSITLEKISKNMKKMKSLSVEPKVSAAKRSVKIKHNDTIYSSYSEAEKKLNIPAATIRGWCLKEKDGWKIL